MIWLIVGIILGYLATKVEWGKVNNKFVYKGEYKVTTGGVDKTILVTGYVREKIDDDDFDWDD